MAKLMKRRRVRAGKRKPWKRSGKKLVVNRALQPIAQRYICRMKYCDSFSMDTSGSATGIVPYRFRLNSIYDPNLTGGGHKPYGFDQLLGFPNASPKVPGLYNRYRVISASFTLQCAVTSTQPGQSVQLTALPANEAVSTGITDGAALRENPRAKWISQTTGAPLRILKGKVYLPSLVGRNKTQYMADDRYQSTYDANPLEAAILNVYLNNFGDGSGIVTPVQARVSIEITYNVELFDVNNMPQSSQSP